MMLFWNNEQPSEDKTKPIALFQKWKIDKEDNFLITIPDLNITTQLPIRSNILSDTEDSVGVIDSIEDRNIYENLTLDSQDLNNTVHYHFPVYLRIWATTVIVIMLVAGVCGNILVPILVCKTRELRHSTNIFLLNLAAADILVMIICLPTALVELHSIPDTWVLGAAMCRIVPYIEVCVTRASVLTLVIISMERWVAICQPLSSPVVCTRPRAALLCLGVWPFVTLTSVPTIVLTEINDHIYSNGSTIHVCTTNITTVPWGPVYHIVCLVVFFFLPFFFLLIIYTLIIHRLVCHQTSTRHQPSRRCDKSQWTARKQVVGMLGTVVIVFFISVLPFQLFTLWIILVPRETVINLGSESYYNVLYVCRCLFYVNSAANPIIYNAMSSKFRAALYRYLGLSRSSKTKLLRRQSTMTTTTASLSSSSFRRRASSILSHRPIDIFGRKGSIVAYFHRKSEPSIDRHKISDCTNHGVHEVVSNMDDGGIAKKETNVMPLQKSNYELSHEFHEIPVIKEELYINKDISMTEFNFEFKSPPSPLSLPSASSSHTSTPPSSPLYALMPDPADDCSRSPSLATPETTKKVSFSESVFHWYQGDKIKIPVEEHKLHTWRTSAMSSRKAKYKGCTQRANLNSPEYKNTNI